MSGGFKRSSWFGLVGVFVVAALVAVIALTMGQGDPNPKPVPLLIGGPLIAIAALYGSFRAIGPGGEIQQAYDRTDRAMKPLGLQVTETPKGGFEMRYPTTPGFDYRLHGWTVMGGERHGRRVSVRLGGHEDAGASEVHVAEPCHEFGVKSKRVEVSSGLEGILVTRKKGGQRDWLCDLWLAEQLASA